MKYPKKHSQTSQYIDFTSSTITHHTKTYPCFLDYQQINKTPLFLNVIAKFILIFGLQTQNMEKNIHPNPISQFKIFQKEAEIFSVYHMKSIV